MSNLEIKKTYGLIAGPLNNKLIADLRQKGEEVLVFPAIKTTNVKLTEIAVDLIKNPTDFDWIILTEVFAADYFIEVLRERETDFFELDNLTVCALGEAVADRLRFIQVHADVIPPNNSDEAVFSEIRRFVGGELKNLRLAVLRENSKIFSFAEMLRRENAVVEELPVYKAGFVDESEITKLKTLLKGGAVDEFVFSSAEDVLVLRFLFPDNDLPEILNECKISAANENAFHALQENGLRPLYFHHK